MQVIITAVGPDNKGLADPIIHHVSGGGANIYEIQMYDRDTEHLFAMMMRIDWPDSAGSVVTLRSHLQEIGKMRGLEVRVWSRDEHQRPPKLAICTTYRTEPPIAILRAIRDGRLKAEAALMIGNRNSCRSLAEQFDVPWVNIADDKGVPDYQQMEHLIDEYEIDYVALARYMRVLPADVCWKFAGGRNQTIHQGTFSVQPGTPLEEIKRQGESDNEPHCLVEGLRRVIDREVELHFHRVARVD